MAVSTATSMPFMTEVRSTSQYSAAETQPSVSTQIAWTPLSLAACRPPRPAGPATGKMMSAPCWIMPSATDWPLDLSSKVLRNEPSLPFQPRSLTSASLSVLYFSMPWRKPSMKMETVGMLRPPKVPTMPVFDSAAAR